MKSLATRRQSSPRTQRSDGWTADRRRAFIESVAAGRTVEAACACVGMSKASVYALRLRDRAFALGWSGATLRSRDALADSLLTRAMEGQVETWILPDGSEGSRRRYDNRLALGLLARLDRLARQDANRHRIEQPEEEAARGIAHDLGGYLEMMEEGEVDAATVDGFVDTQIGQLRQLSSEDRLCDIENSGGKGPGGGRNQRKIIIERVIRYVDDPPSSPTDGREPECDAHGSRTPQADGDTGPQPGEESPTPMAVPASEAPRSEARPVVERTIPVMRLARYDKSRSIDWTV